MAFLFSLNAYSILLGMDTERPQYNTALREISLPIDKKYKNHKLTIKALTKDIIFGNLFTEKYTKQK